MKMSENNEELDPTTVDESAAEKDKGLKVGHAGGSVRIAVPDPMGIAVPDPM